MRAGLHGKEEIADICRQCSHGDILKVELDKPALHALKQAVAALNKRQGAAPADVLEPLIAIAKPGMKLRLDVAASDTVGAPVVSIDWRRDGDLLQFLTNRQKQVALLMIEGLSNRQIASRLGISIATVKDHVHAILDRLELPSRIALIAASHTHR